MATKMTNAGFKSMRDSNTQTMNTGRVEGQKIDVSYKLMNNQDNSPLDRQFHSMVENGHLDVLN
jgi:DNA-binding ferritin-like protein